jgi:hypothetical protein
MRLFFLLLVPFLFVIHMAAAIVSPAVRKQIGQHRLLHLGWFVISAGVTVLIILAFSDHATAR